MKHAYLIVAHANFKVVETCLKCIDDERNDVFLLLDRKARVPSETVERLKHACVRSKVTVMEAVVNWAGYSQIAAVLALLRAANASPTEYSYLHFMQGADLPIRTQDEIHAYFDAHAGKQFVMIERSRGAMAVNKTHYRHFFCHNRFFRRNRIMKALNFGLVYLQRLLHIRKRMGMEVYQGSALFSVTGACARYIESKEGEIRRLFRFSLAGDEVFLQSMLMASAFRDDIMDAEREVSSNARLIDRTRPDGKNSPHIWRAEELPYILSRPEGICFARKFDENVDLEIVEQIYRHIKETAYE